MKSQLNIAFYQQDICWQNPSANYDKVRAAFATYGTDASLTDGQEADILVVPETFNTGFGDHMAATAEPQEGSTLQFAREMAAQYNALFVGTWTVKESGKVYNRLHWVCPDGSYGSYDKGHTFRMSSEASQVARGTSQALLEWRGWRIKPAVCYDLRFPKWLRNTWQGEQADYDLLLVCANWPGSRSEAWTTLLKARAIENLSYVVGVNRCGTDAPCACCQKGIRYTGDSVAVDFKGLICTQCPHGQEGVRRVSLNAEALQTFRRHWPFYLDAD